MRRFIVQLPRSLRAVSRRHGDVCTFFLLLLLSICFMLVGIAWRSLDDGADERTRLFAAAVENTKSQLGLYEEKLRFELFKATNQLDQFVLDTKARFEMLREDLTQKVSRLELEHQKALLERDNAARKEMEGLVRSFREAEQELKKRQTELALKVEQSVLENNKALHKAGVELQEKYREAERRYLHEAQKLGYFRQELEVLLDGLEQDLEVVEAEILKSSVGNLAHPERIVSARVKLKVFLDEYRERMRLRAQEPGTPEQLDPIDWKLVEPKFSEESFTIPVAQQMLNQSGYSPLTSDGIQTALATFADNVFTNPPSMSLAAEAPEIPSVEIAGIAVRAKLWVLPVAVSLLLFALAICLGIEMLKTPGTKTDGGE